ncbi:MAG: 2-C-methyl-D-erythritol 4-phosphate cytidylyltransferase [Thermoguttaceae bacterium]|nr:2-C-methyl-D-erythritol 4-phosphate cytidylyltransferase [Thermoguttaceae bacterium]
MAKYAVIIAAAGRSRRFNEGTSRLGNALAQKKPFASFKGRAVWLYSAELFARRRDVAQQILVVSPEDRAEVERRFAADLAFHGVRIVEGGAERFLSVENALKAVSEEADFVAVHDAARPCVTDADVERVFAEAARTNAAILAVPVVGSLKRSKTAEKRLVVAESTPRENLWEAQTPQVFSKELLTRAYRERPKTFQPTDDCGLVEALGVDVSIVEGSRLNIKITSAEDLTIAEKFIEIVGKRNTKNAFFF